VRPLRQNSTVPLSNEQPRSFSVSTRLATAAVQRWSGVLPSDGDPRAPGRPPHCRAPSPRVQVFGLARADALNVASMAAPPDPSSRLLIILEGVSH
jgi:hypothetical protein